MKGIVKFIGELIFAILAVVFVVGALYLGLNFGYPLYQKSNKPC